MGKHRHFITNYNYLTWTITKRISSNDDIDNEMNAMGKHRHFIANTII